MDFAYAKHLSNVIPSMVIPRESSSIILNTKTYGVYDGRRRFRLLYPVVCIILVEKISRRVLDTLP